jgi:hypothetical protein
MESKELKPCLFCGSEKLEARGVPFVGYMVTCWNCLARGSSKETAEEAIDVWNKAWNKRANND